MGKKVLIIGAGPAGLAAAYELIQRSDIKPVVLEASSEIGGLSRTVNHNGNRIDIGGHRFFSKSDRIMKWWQTIMPIQGLPLERDRSVETPPTFLFPEHGPDPGVEDKVMLIRKRVSHILFLGKLFDYPISPGFSTLKRLGWINTMRIAVSYIDTRLGPTRPQQTLEDFFIHRFGKELYRIFFKDYTEKVWGVSCRRIRPEWGHQRIKNLSIIKTIMNAIKESFSPESTLEQHETETSLIKAFLYPKYGPGQFWEETARIVTEGGGKILLNHCVDGLRSRGRRVKQIHVTNTKSGEGGWIGGDHFFSSMPVRDLILGFEGDVPDFIRMVAGGLVYRDFIIVGLLLNKMNPVDKKKSGNETILSDQWLYIQGKEVRVGRVQIFNNWSTYLLKDPNQAWIGAEYFCNAGDSVWRLSQEEMINLALTELEVIGLINRGDFIDGLVIKAPDAYPAYLGSYPQFHHIRSFTDALENLSLIGRNGMHRYNNMDHSMLSAITAVDNLLNGVTSNENVWSVNTEKALQEVK